MSIDDKELTEKILGLVREAIRHDEELRNKHTVGDKFRFVRDRLHAVLTQLEAEIHAKKVKMTTKAERAADETLIYVYLYNAEGVVLRNWRNMLTPKLFYEYSVNRPIYAEKQQVESLVKRKTNKAQHAYITVAIKKVDVIGESPSKDAVGNPVLRVKEGSLRFENLIEFTHNGIEYVLSSDGEFKKHNVL